MIKDKFDHNVYLSKLPCILLDTNLNCNNIMFDIISQ